MQTYIRAYNAGKDLRIDEHPPVQPCPSFGFFFLVLCSTIDLRFLHNLVRFDMISPDNSARHD